MNLYSITQQQAQINSQIEAYELALIEAGGELTPELEEQGKALTDALAISEDALTAKAEGYAEVLAYYADLSTNAKQRAQQFTRIAKVAENAEKRLKMAILTAMQVYGVERIELTDGRKYSLRKSEAVEVADLNELDPHFVKVKTEADKVAIKKALKEGQAVKGAKLITNHSLQLK